MPMEVNDSYNAPSTRIVEVKMDCCILQMSKVDYGFADMDE